MELAHIVRDFAAGMEAADQGHPQAASHRDSARLYQPGIGPFGEDDAVAMTLTQMQAAHGDTYMDAGKRRYPSGRYVCDLALGPLPDWAIVKLARLGRDNGTSEDAAIKKILSPYADDRSAVTDCQKLAGSGFAGRLAVMIYGFEDSRRPLSKLIDAFEAIAIRTVSLGPRVEAALAQLIHPVFTTGRVFAWEILTPDSTDPS
jgi:hypothetical protein